ncbi:MAG: nucleotidyltransferase domain-containing protein [Egibacteraceae bacterium]
MSTASELLKAARRTTRMSQRALAVRAGTSQSVVQRIEAGQVQPSLETLARLLRAAGHELRVEAVPTAGEDPGGLRRLLRERRDDIVAVAERHGARNVRVFGSVARGDHKATSDIDLLVDFDHGRSVFDLLRIEHELTDLLGAPVQVVSSGGLRDRDQHVRQEAVPL